MPDGSMTIVGSLGRDPELRFTQGSRALCSFTVAVGHRYKSGDEWKEETSWVDVTAWGDLGEHVAASTVKGTRVIVAGRIRQEEWVDKESGKKRSKLGLVADYVGLELRFATAEAHRVERESSAQRQARGYDEADPFA